MAEDRDWRAHAEYLEEALASMRDELTAAQRKVLYLHHDRSALLDVARRLVADGQGDVFLLRDARLVLERLRCADGG